MPARAPETRHEIQLAGEKLSYLLRRSQRRTIGLSIDARGLRVAAPQRSSKREIEALILQHGHWVVEKLGEWRERASSAPTPVSDGLVIFAIAEALTVKISPERRFAWRISDNTLQLDLPPTVEPARALESALREHARQYFQRSLARYAPLLGVAPPPLRLSSARTRWGSCSRQGGISLNWRLVLMPPAVVDYVVCHELAHLREMNHSPRFWSVVESLCPDWRTQREALRQLGRELPVFSC